MPAKTPTDCVITRSINLKYMINMKKLFSFCLICFMALSASAQQMEYVDFGLPSGTLWKSVDEPGLYTYDEATSKFGDQLPTNEQM